MSIMEFVARGLGHAADRVVRVARTWSFNTANTAVYIFSGGNRVLHEGVYSRYRGAWQNWNRMFQVKPLRFETPETEEDICRVVTESARLRVVGGGHTFNASPLSEGTMLSLDKYTRVLSVDKASRRVRVQAGIRLCDLTSELLKHGLALPVQGSTDAQSVGGLLSTDIHGTGRDHGFLSTNIRSLRLIDGAGRARTLTPEEEEFHAAIGGLGTCGVITEVEIECVDAFNLRKAIKVVRRDWVAEHIDEIIQEHDHVSFYYIGGVQNEHVRMNTWDRTIETPSPLEKLYKMRLELTDMLFSGYLLGLSRVLGLSSITASLGLLFFKVTMDGHSTVYPSRSAFPRKLFFDHDELEYGVAFEAHRECLAEVLQHLEQQRFVTIVEVRFTPNQSEALLGPGVGRRTTHIELAPSLSVDSSRIFEEVEKMLWRHGGQLHLGKATWATEKEMTSMYQDRFTRFRSARRSLDPEGKFTNAFAARLFERKAPPTSVEMRMDGTGSLTPSPSGA